jgi:uncharacterized protein (TIGR02284 family)
MARTNDNVISTLNNLIERCKDREIGYLTAAKCIETHKFKTLLSTYARQSAQFAFELQREVRRLGGDPEKSGSLGAAMHRG